MSRSPYFIGTIGETVSPTEFAPGNYLTDDTRYSYEGNWAFCRFDGDEVYGARFGFGRGMFDGLDYGIEEPLDRSFLMLHLELMTREGAVLWIGSGNGKAQRVEIAKEKMDMRLQDGDHEIFRVSGWPEMTWHFESDDRQAEVNMRLNAQSVTILPDCVMERNLFAMWMAICRVDGEVRFGNKRTRVTGTAFYDHPRINAVPNKVPPFGWYLYTPMRFSDGSHLTSYYTQDRSGKRVDNYCFGLYVDANGKGTWLPSSEFNGMRLDADNKPSEWHSRWVAPGFTAEIRARVKPTSILKAWGSPSVPTTRKENGNIPLIFDCAGTVEINASRRTVHGGGLAEYLPRIGLTPSFP